MDYDYRKENNWLSPMSILSKGKWYYSSAGTRTIDGVKCFAIFGVLAYNKYVISIKSTSCVYIPCVYLNLPVKVLKIQERDYIS